jgi:hypothetical protein
MDTIATSRLVHESMAILYISSLSTVVGLTLHYNGSFDRQASLEDMIEEVAEIAEIQEWPYDMFERKFPPGKWDAPHDGQVFGISVCPPHSEPLFLTFLSNGRMVNPIALQHFGHSPDPKERGYIYHLWTKTQFAGMYVHQLVVHLLRYVEQKYLAELNVTDEGRYWETGEEQVLQQQFEKYNQAMDVTKHALNHIPRKAKEAPEDYLERIIRQIGKKKIE